MIGEESIYDSPDICEYRRYLEDNHYVLHATLMNMLEDGITVLERHSRSSPVMQNDGGREGNDGSSDEGNGTSHASYHDEDSNDAREGDGGEQEEIVEVSQI